MTLTSRISHLSRKLKLRDSLNPGGLLLIYTALSNMLHNSCPKRLVLETEESARTALSAFRSLFFEHLFWTA